jgi:hypothetical protein
MGVSNDSVACADKVICVQIVEQKVHPYDKKRLGACHPYERRHSVPVQRRPSPVHQNDFVNLIAGIGYGEQPRIAARGTLCESPYDRAIGYWIARVNPSVPSSVIARHVQ